jgi:UDP-3-O-[3-hydroxymyristoyl] glucosamine N-acyltransferase
MKFEAQQIAAMLEGILEGDARAEISRLDKIEEGAPGGLSFLANPQYLPYIYTTQASAVIVAQDFVAEKPVNTTLIRVADPYASFARLLDVYNSLQHNQTGVDALAFVDSTAQVGQDVFIGAFSYIGKNVTIGANTKIYPQVFLGDDVSIGSNCLVFPGVKIYAQSKLGDDVTVHGGTIIGADGFGFAPNAGELYKKVAQIGNVVIEDHVEIGANCAIDRATMGSTRIRRGVKLDNQIQIAHNVEIGENTVMAAQCGVAGSTKIGKNCMIGGQVGFAGHLTIGDGVRIAAQTGVASNIADGSTVMGSPAMDYSDYKRSFVMYKRLPEIMTRLEKLEKLNKTTPDNPA